MTAECEWCKQGLVKEGGRLVVDGEEEKRVCV
jgi:hypothetical protein